jgi:NitT/TauT family transport system permease protein
VTASVGRWLPPVLFGIAVLLAWQLVVVVAQVPAFLLPAPTAIATQIAAQLPTLVSTTLVTGANSLVGLVAGFVLGVALALLAARSRLVYELSTPVVLAASAVPVFVSTVRGLRQVRPVHAELMTALAATPGQFARFVRLPGAVPYIMTGLRVAAPAAVIAAIVAEYFGGLQNGLGSRISAAAANTAYARAWAFVAASIVLGLLFHLAGVLAERLVTRGRST